MRKTGWKVYLEAGPGPVLILSLTLNLCLNLCLILVPALRLARTLSLCLPSGRGARLTLCVTNAASACSKTL